MISIKVRIEVIFWAKERLVIRMGSWRGPSVAVQVLFLDLMVITRVHLIFAGVLFLYFILYNTNLKIWSKYVKIVKI